LKILPTLIILFFSFSLTAQDNFEAEDEIWNCIITEYLKLNIDFNAEIEAYEQFMVDENYLSEASAAGYLDLKNRMQDLGDILPPPHNEHFAAVKQTLFERGSNLDCIDDEIVFQTRIYEIQQAVIEAVKDAKDLHVELIVFTMMDMFSEKDLEHPMNRFTLVGMLQAYVNRTEGIPENLPPPPPPPPGWEDPVKISERNKIDLKLLDGELIQLEGETIAFDDLRSTIKIYMKGSKTDASLPEIVAIEVSELGMVDSSKAVIMMEPDREVSYKLYKMVQDEVVAAFKELRDEVAIKHFNQKYEALREEHQEIIKKVIPFRLQ
jgi:hypothetical protein